MIPHFRMLPKFDLWRGMIESELTLANESRAYWVWFMTMKNMKAMKCRAKAAISLLQDLQVLHGENTSVLLSLVARSNYALLQCIVVEFYFSFNCTPRDEQWTQIICEFLLLHNANLTDFFLVASTSQVGLKIEWNSPLDSPESQ